LYMVVKHLTLGHGHTIGSSKEEFKN
jgi:hypothetical protein